MTLIRATNVEMDSGLKLGALARIWKGGCIIRAIFLDHIKQAYDRNLQLANLLVDAEILVEPKFDDDDDDDDGDDDGGDGDGGDGGGDGGGAGGDD
ncbi:hypothetical protein Tco_0259959, partial [Tanacetum coccineum]